MATFELTVHLHDPESMEHLRGFMRIWAEEFESLGFINEAYAEEFLYMTRHNKGMSREMYRDLCEVSSVDAYAVVDVQTERTFCFDCFGEYDPLVHVKISPGHKTGCWIDLMHHSGLRDCTGPKIRVEGKIHPHRVLKKTQERFIEFLGKSARDIKPTRTWDEKISSCGRVEFIEPITITMEKYGDGIVAISEDLHIAWDGKTEGEALWLMRLEIEGAYNRIRNGYMDEPYDAERKSFLDQVVKEV